MMNARRQAENYVRLLPPEHAPPPFVLVCDVAHCIEVYANFRRDGKAYDQFPDRQGFRIYLEDLRKEEVRDRLKRIWTDPMSLDPARHSARVTRAIAERLAAVSKALEREKYPAEAVAMFLMRVLFTMFAEDVGLLPPKSFQNLLADCELHPESFVALAEDLWTRMDQGGFAASIRRKVPRFNGEFFKERRAFPLGPEEIGELRRAAEYDWRDVEPAIFGTLLEQALDKDERRRLGAHYTPRAYVERLVVATIIEPLREDWAAALATAERQKGEGRANDAIKTVRAFHDKLCGTRVLDPACGTGNFLYVSLELMKKLEGDVLEALADLGGQEALSGLERHTVDPHGFYGIEINPRAAAIAELVLWIGYLQWHFRTKGGVPSEPILKAFKNIQHKDAVLTWDGYPLPKVVKGKEIYPNARRPDWPEAEFIVGNPPFIGKGEPMRASLGDAKLKALWAAHPHINESADFVMYWWDYAAEILLHKATKLKRFGFVTTNSITQIFNRRVVEKRLAAKNPLSLLLAIPDHPWTKAACDSAAVRISMTAAGEGRSDGVLREVVDESALETDASIVSFRDKFGKINSDLTVGVDITSSVPLKSNEGLSSNGVMLAGDGFIVSASEAEFLGLGSIIGTDLHIRDYRNGRDLAGRSRSAKVIDLYGLEIDEVRARFPKIYQHLLERVKPIRDKNADRGFRERWWLFGRPRSEIRPALAHLSHYIATIETTKHRVFQFLDGRVLPDHMLIAIALGDGSALGVLSSRVHVIWALAQGGTLEDRPRYSKTVCFDSFPFPSATEAQKAVIGTIAEELDAHRKRVLAEHPHLTLTGLYNVLERLRDGAARAELNEGEQRIYDDGLVLILKELHDRLDVAVAEAYGWPADLTDEDILARLVALNRERAEEERHGFVRWLRPDYQIPRFGSAQEKAAQIEADLSGGMEGGMAVAAKLAFPADEVEQTGAVIRVLLDADTPLGIEGVTSAFRNGGRAKPKVRSILEALTRQGVAGTADGGHTFTVGRVV